MNTKYTNKKAILFLLSFFLINLNNLCYSAQSKISNQKYWKYLLFITKNKGDVRYFKKVMKHKKPVHEDAKKPLFKTLRKLGLTRNQINILFAKWRLRFGDKKANKIFNSSKLPFKLSSKQICGEAKRKAFYAQVLKTRGGSPADVILSPMGTLLCLHNFWWD